MVCKKCGYSDKNEKQKFNAKLCLICFHFSPENKKDFDNYIKEKIDWKLLDTFRKYNQSSGEKLKKGMKKQAQKGKPMSRAPLGYDIQDRKLIPNKDSSKLHSLFKTFLEKKYSLNSLSKNYGLSVNGLKKVLANRTYLGEIKFAGTLNKGLHQPIISQELFYAVQRKLKEILRS